MFCIVDAKTVKTTTEGKCMKPLELPWKRDSDVSYCFAHTVEVDSV